LEAFFAMNPPNHLVHDIIIPSTLESERLLLRPYRFTDAPVLAQTIEEERERLREDFPDRVSSVHSTRDAELFITEKSRQWKGREAFHFGIWERGGERYAGEICLRSIDWRVPRADVGYYLCRRFERKGIMVEALRKMIPLAFDVLQIRKMQIRCAVSNVRSRRVAERCGFRLEGVLRNDAVRADGATLVNVVYYGLTPDDRRGHKLRPPDAGGLTGGA
jgi:RimJ/RimL family protein N-acetyltransferase